MTAAEFANIKQKIKDEELKSANAKGRIDAIKEKWQSKYGFSSLEEAEKKLSELEEDRMEKIHSKEQLEEKLKNSFDWDSI